MTEMTHLSHSFIVSNNLISIARHSILKSTILTNILTNIWSKLF